MLDVHDQQPITHKYKNNLMLASVSRLTARKRGSDQRVLVHGVDTVGPLSVVLLIGITFPLCET